MKVYQLRAELEQLEKDGYAHAEVVGPRKEIITSKLGAKNFCAVAKLTPWIFEKSDGSTILEEIQIQFKDE
jgi:hypothetical protein